ncbi:MAG: anhydro-N-acetylmuramic acid kinase [Flavobacteriaceae bacterium]|nr:anhydro-N-acetylmuramic acid kinase [Flavobacteriaceae bacterium]
MKKLTYHVLGVMSGTSLDGIDVAEIIFNVSENGTWDYKIISSETVSYAKGWKYKLQKAISFSEQKLIALNSEYTLYLAKVISEFISRKKISKLDAVCSHGHTILHQPQKGITLQIGNLLEIASLINQKVVCDFRVQDLNLGGNGAPLVPIGDRLLFSEYDYCLNLGGFANVSFEEKIKQQKSKRVAYDVCPVNIVLNYLAEQKGYLFDESGDLARSGKLSKELFQQLNDLPFYKMAPPKSLGLEWVKKEVFPLLKSSAISIEDQLHTITEHVAFQLSNQFKKDSNILVTGGGTYNSYLLERITHYKTINLIIPSPELIEYKEALIFGLLGILKLRNENNCLKSVTGAKKDHSSGVIFFSKNELEKG